MNLYSLDSGGLGLGLAIVVVDLFDIRADVSLRGLLLFLLVRVGGTHGVDRINIIAKKNTMNLFID